MTMPLQQAVRRPRPTALVAPGQRRSRLLQCRGSTGAVEALHDKKGLPRKDSKGRKKPTQTACTSPRISAEPPMPHRT